MKSIRRTLAAKSAEKRRFSDEEEARICAMHKAGQSIRGLARIYQCDVRTIQAALTRGNKSPWIQEER